MNCVPKNSGDWQRSAKVCIRADFPTLPTTSEFFEFNFLQTSAPHTQFKNMHPEEAQRSLHY